MTHDFTALEAILKTDIDFLEKIRAISETIKMMVQADLCTIFIHDPKTRSFWSAYIEGISFIEIPDNSGIVHEIFNTNQARIINNVQEEKEYNERVEKSSGYHIHSMIAAPLIDKQNRPIGVIQVINKLSEAHQFSETDKNVVTRLLKHINQYTESLSGR